MRDTVARTVGRIIYEGLYEGFVLGALVQAILASEAVLRYSSWASMHFYDHRGVNDVR